MKNEFVKHRKKCTRSSWSRPDSQFIITLMSQNHRQSSKRPDRWVDSRRFTLSCSGQGNELKGGESRDSGLMSTRTPTEAGTLQCQQTQLARRPIRILSKWWRATPSVLSGGRGATFGVSPQCLVSLLNTGQAIFCGAPPAPVAASKLYPRLGRDDCCPCRRSRIVVQPSPFPEM